MEKLWINANGDACMQIYGRPVEFSELLRAMANLEALIEASGDARAIAAFQCIGEMIARGRMVERTGEGDAEVSRKEADERNRDGLRRHFGLGKEDGGPVQ